MMMFNKRIVSVLAAMFFASTVAACATVPAKKKPKRMRLLPLNGLPVKKKIVKPPKPKTKTLKQLLKQHPRLAKLHKKMWELKTVYKKCDKKNVETEDDLLERRVVDIKFVEPSLEKVAKMFLAHRKNDPARYRLWLTYKAFRMLFVKWQIHFMREERLAMLSPCNLLHHSADKAAVSFWATIVTKAPHFRNQLKKAQIHYSIGGETSMSLHKDRKENRKAFRRQIKRLKGLLKRVHNEKMPPLNSRPETIPPLKL